MGGGGDYKCGTIGVSDENVKKIEKVWERWGGDHTERQNSNEMKKK